MSLRHLVVMTAAIFLAAGAAQSEEVNLLFGTTLPSAVHLNVRVLHP